MRNLNINKLVMNMTDGDVQNENNSQTSLEPSLVEKSVNFAKVWSLTTRARDLCDELVIAMVMESAKDYRQILLDCVSQRFYGCPIDIKHWRYMYYTTRGILHQLLPNEDLFNEGGHNYLKTLNIQPRGQYFNANLWNYKSTKYIDPMIKVRLDDEIWDREQMLKTLEKQVLIENTIFKGVTCLEGIKISKKFKKFLKLLSKARKQTKIPKLKNPCKTSTPLTKFTKSEKVTFKSCPGWSISLTIGNSDKNHKEKYKKKRANLPKFSSFEPNERILLEQNTNCSIIFSEKLTISKIYRTLKKFIKFKFYKFNFLKIPAKVKINNSTSKINNNFQIINNFQIRNKFKMEWNSTIRAILSNVMTMNSPEDLDLDWKNIQTEIYKRISRRAIFGNFQLIMQERIKDYCMSYRDTLRREFYNRFKNHKKVLGSLPEKSGKTRTKKVLENILDKECRRMENIMEVWKSTDREFYIETDRDNNNYQPNYYRREVVEDGWILIPNGDKPIIK